MSWKKYPSLRAAAEDLLQDIADGRLHEALYTIYHIVQHIITEPTCVAWAYGSAILDDVCQKIGLASLREIDIPAMDPPQRPTFVYIATKLQKQGGHTRVLADFIRARPQAQHILLLTMLDGPSDDSYLVNQCAQGSKYAIETAPLLAFDQRLQWLQKRLLALRPHRTYLFTHHQDSVAIAAVQPSMALPTSFYHHGDHHLCLGVYLPHVEHIDPHPMGYHNCQKNLKRPNVSYIPLTVEDQGDIGTQHWPFYHQTLTTCTAAQDRKVTTPYCIGYTEVIPALLKETGGQHIHMGRLLPWTVHTIRRQLRRLHIPRHKFLYVPWVPSVWKALHAYHVDLYVASFPYGGGRTLIEALGAGIPVALHQHLFSPILSSIGLAYETAFRWQKPAELYSACRTMTRDDLQHHSRLARAHYEAFHSSAILQRLLDEKMHYALLPNASEHEPPQQDEWAYWMSTQHSYTHWIRNNTYRLLRRVYTKIHTLTTRW